MNELPKTATPIKTKAKLMRPRGKEAWVFLRLPVEASKKLPTRSMCSVGGTFDGSAGPRSCPTARARTG